MTKSILRRTDLTLLAAVAGIVIMSLIIIGSATHVNTPGEERYWYVARQGLFAAVNLAFAAVFMDNRVSNICISCPTEGRHK